jgi:hypothetical protein
LSFPEIAADWSETRRLLQAYARILGQIRRQLSPAHKHWWHASLRPTAIGLSTGPLIVGDTAYELVQDFTLHQILITNSRGESLREPMLGQSPRAFGADLRRRLQTLGLEIELDEAGLDESDGRYRLEDAAAWWRSVLVATSVFERFGAEQREEISPVQLWPHHFDLALAWFSGRRVPGVDPADAEHADEQIGFGYSPGDATIPEPYFYAGAYPAPDGLDGGELPQGARWQCEGYTGAALPYAAIAGREDGEDILLEFLRAAQARVRALWGV